MSEQLQLRRGTAAQVASFTGAAGEVVVDTTNNRVVVNDGSTTGGFAAAKLSEVVTNARIGVGDAAYTVQSTDRMVAFTSLTAARTVTLPAATGFPTGTRLLVIDESGACSTANTITIARAGTDTISGQTSAVINTPFGYLAIESNGSNAWTVIDSSVLVPNAVFRNRFINPAMAIDQRNAGAAQTITAAAALAYTVDRWWAACTGANVTGQRIANSGLSFSPSQYAYQFTGAASVTGIQFGQRIQAADSFDLAGSTAVFSIPLANSLLTTVTWTAYYANSADTFGTLASPSKTQIATGTFTVSSTLALYSASFAVPSAATNGIEIVFSVGAQTSGTWTIGGRAQFEAGAAPTAFERRDGLTELAMCQRRCWIWNPGVISAGLAVAVVMSATDVRTVIGFPEPMAAAPTVTPSAAGTWSIAGSGAALTPSAVSGSSTSTTSTVFDFTVSGATAGQAAYVRAGGATTTLKAEAEL